MNDQQFASRIAYAPRHPSTTAGLLAHVMLWLQAGLFVLAWALPITFVVVLIAIDGIAYEGAYLLWIPVILAVIPFLLSLPAIAVAAMFSRRRNGVHWGAIGYESLVVVSAVLIAILLGNSFSTLFIAMMLLALGIVGALLYPAARARFAR